MSNKTWGFWGTVATGVTALIFPPLAPVIALSALTGWAVFSDGDERTPRRKVTSTALKESSLRSDFNQLTEEFPTDLRERLYQAIEARLEEESRKLLGDKEGTIALARKDGKILAWISPDGEERHVIEFQMP